MTIYIDIIFLENLILNFIILYATGIISKEKIIKLRLIIASNLGAIYAIMYYIFPSKIYSNIISKAFLSIIMIYIAFLPKNVKELIKKILFFLLTSFAFGGASLGLIYISNAQNISIQNGKLIGNYTVKTVFIGAIIAFFVVIYAFRFVKTKFSKKDLLCNIKIKIEKKEVETKAMLDTGNLLKEPITNIPVVVVEYTVLNKIVPDAILENIENILGGDLKNIPEQIKNQYMSKLKVIPFSSLGKQNGMLLGIKADGLEVQEESEVKKVDKVIIGIYNKKLSKKGEYSALLGFDMIA